MLCGLMAARPSIGQDVLHFESYGIDDGLSQSTVWSIAQDRNNFLWLGTADGICRFDGYNFTTYRDNGDDTHSVNGGEYYKTYVDSTKALWVISQNGISLYNDNKDNFTRIFSCDKNRSSPGYNHIFGEDKDYIWAGLSGYGIVKIDKRTYKSACISIPPSFSQSFTSWRSGLVCEGKVWIGAYYGGLYIYDIKSGILTQKSNLYISKLINLNHSEVIATTDTDLILINKHDYSYRSAGNVKALLHKYETINDLHIDAGGDIEIASSKGLFYIDGVTWQLKKKIQSFVPGQAHSYTYIECLFADRSGNLWVGTNGDGLKKIAPTYKKFRLYSSFNDGGNVVKAIYADRKNLYVGYFNTGLDIFDREKGFIRNVSVFNKCGIQLNHVFGITPIDSSSLIILPVAEQFLYAYAPLTAKISPLTAPVAQALPGVKKINNINPFITRQGNTIYTILYDKVLSFDVSAQGAIKSSLVQAFPGEELTCCFKDRNNVLWVGSHSGLFYIAGGVVHYKNVLPQQAHVKTINEDNLGNTWIGTVKGIYLLDSNKRQVACYTEKNALANQFVYGILKDNDGNMWFSHNKGLSEYKPATRRFRHYTQEDGLQSSEFNTGAYFKSEDGALFFGGINGTNCFYPAEIRDNPNAPVTRITSIKLFDEPLQTDSAYWSKSVLELPYNQNSLSFDFVATEFTNPRKNQYAYMMQGIDKTWIKSGDKHFARYPALPPGDYIFKVKASNNDGVWQLQPTELHIKIVAPFWQTLWFRLLLVLTGTGIVSGAMITIQRFRSRNKRRADELQLKIRNERERISRDLHDSVGTQLSLISNNMEWIAYPIKEFTEEERQDRLKHITQRSKEVIATLRDSIWVLNKETITIEEFADKLKSFIHAQLQLHTLTTFRYNETITQNITLSPNEALNLFRICQEGISNALKYAEATELHVLVEDGNDRYSIQIADNGCGFEPTNNNATKGYGLHNMKHRAKDINATLTLISAIGEGTKFTIAKN
jgi:signal transduction histidine kinase/ligand-binding sensor domain-containing protein